MRQLLAAAAAPCGNQVSKGSLQQRATEVQYVDANLLFVQD